MESESYATLGGFHAAVVNDLRAINAKLKKLECKTFGMPIVATVEKPPFVVDLDDDEFATLKKELEAAKKEAEELRIEFAVMARACGNWRTFPGQPEGDHDHPDWKCAARAILERDALKSSPAGRVDVEKIMDYLHNTIGAGGPWTWEGIEHEIRRNLPTPVAARPMPALADPFPIPQLDIESLCKQITAAMPGPTEDAALITGIVRSWADAK